jgi:gas vesicle protein GvpN
MLLFGDDEFKTSDLIGNQLGYTRKKVVDNFIHSVVKLEDELRHNWVDSRLTLACREGFTLVYDEFNRSRPEVNNVLLSALEEKLLVLPPSGNRTEYIRVNPHFRAIFTSNPEEYCGVHDTQDALLDRLITINMPEPDELTQQEITVHKTGIDRQGAALIVHIVKTFRQRSSAENSSGLRSCLMIAKICHEHEIEVIATNDEFRDICQDMLMSRTSLRLPEATQLLWDIFNELIGATLEPVVGLSELANTRLWESGQPVPLAIEKHTEDEAPSLEVPPSTEASQLSQDVLPEEIVEESAIAIGQEKTDEQLTTEVQNWNAVDGMTIQTVQTEEPTLMFSVEAAELTSSNLTALEEESLTLDHLSQAVAEDACLELDNPELDEDGSLASPEEAIAPMEQVNDLLAISQDESVDPSLAEPSASAAERAVLAYIHAIGEARPTELEAALGLNRFQTINALRSLVDQGVLIKHNGGSKASIYRLHPSASALT